MAVTADRTTAAHMINGFRIVSVISIPLMGHLPSVCGRSTFCHHSFLVALFVTVSFQGLNLYVLTGIAMMLTQTSILQRDVVRRMLRLPLLPKNTNLKPVTFQESIDHLKKWFREQNQVARERALKGKKW